MNIESAHVRPLIRNTNYLPSVPMLKAKVLFVAVLLLSFAAITFAEPAPGDNPKPSKQKQQPLIDPELAIKQFEVPAGFKVDLFASEPQLLNPVAFCFDEQGRIYVAETFRYRKSVYDI